MFDDIPDVRISDSHLGEVGSGDYFSNAAFRFTCTQHNCSGPGATNTISIVNTQINQGYQPINHFAEFVDAGPNFYGADFGDITFTNVHAELVNTAFYSDASWLSIRHVNIIGSMINCTVTNAVATGEPFFSLNRATAVDRWNIVASNLFALGTIAGGNAAFRLGQTPARGGNITEFHWVGSSIFGDFYFTGYNGATMYITGTSWSSNLSFDGSWGALIEMGDNIGGSYFEGVSGPGRPPNVTTYNNRQIKVGGNAGLDCSSGITPSTYRSVKGITTHC